ncbi:oxidoreductase [Leifsonia sp. AG29]|uniref:oxidoreductase n=1 Tax=Leifsonia sp. AG29 TaxID=2598860 RepID=UPI00131DAA35|nr:oxidoreductase [Leifsonia sp. AG29]
MPTAIVTGASSGIGKATVQALTDRGFTVYGLARRNELLAAIAASTPAFRPVQGDVRDNETLVQLVDRAIAETGRIDVVVNNAGYGSYGALEEVAPQAARAQVDVNLLAVGRLTQLVLPAMRRQRAGRIINVSSIGGKIYEPLGAWYHATKFALEGLSDALRIEVAPFGISVSVIEPGAVLTEWGSGASTSLLDVSGSGPYRAQALGLGRVLDSTASNPRRATAPHVVAERIAHAATAARPRIRYVVGAGAKPLVALRRLLPDSVFDALIKRLFRPVDADSDQVADQPTTSTR